VSNKNFVEILPNFPSEVTSVTVEYSGCGDSGDIDFIKYRDEKGIEVIVDDNVDKEVSEFAWNIIDERHGGFYNNEGGNGTIDIDISKRTIDITHNDAYTEYETTNHHMEF
jgi:hypothetical protein